MKYTNENGRSMVEMLGVLAIIGVLSVGGIAGYSKAMNKSKISKTTDQVSMLVANLRTMFSAQGDYDGLGNAQAISFGVVPEDMVSGTSITNAFGGSVIISESPLKSDDTVGDAFVVVYNGLSQEACVSIATGDWGSSQSSGLVGVGAFGTAQTAESMKDVYVGGTGSSADKAAVAQPGGSAVKAPMPVADAVKGCGDTGSANAVTWKYY